MLGAELLEIMAVGAADVDNHGRLLAVVKALDEALLDGEEAGVHPRGAALVVTAHVVVELEAEGVVGLEVLEEVELGVVGELVGSVRDAVGRLPPGLVGPDVELVECGEAAARSVVSVSVK